MKRGFTLIETLIALVVTAIAILTFQFGIQALTAKSQQRYDEQLAWYHMLAKLESDDYGFSLAKVGMQEALLNPQTDKDRQYDIYQYHDKIVMTTDKGGYMPLLTGLHYVGMDNAHGYLKISVITRMNQHLSAVTTIGDVHE
ncbi:competence type IV pilus minor pilin ComGF [Secundilactobacillus folii]|uniref:Prepilin-type N-terminal cleavage/methylation domain-containing protein n=1 Tax=Secundilactobacillus folii TaxID=2678357 RepID=A0A7X2XZJ9_9LACO|nr:competence type IV pilus minor pilin ComGF [Secundilactobacillus folii]MTV83226.1 prepilin-type N-terminal cleavage/methylation domain-containing protein [Secundilactobacillus folii]